MRLNQQQNAQPRSELLSCPQVIIPANVWEKLMAYITTCPIEINGFGYVTAATDGTVHIDDVFILPQVATPGDVVTDQAALAQHLNQMMLDGADTARMRFQWHSHVNGDAYFSSVDTANIDRWPGDWLISLVANIYGEYCCRFDTFQGPIRMSAEIIPTIMTSISAQALRQAREDIATNVRRRGVFKRPLSMPEPSGPKIMPRADAAHELYGDPMHPHDLSLQYSIEGDPS